MATCRRFFEQRVGHRVPRRRPVLRGDHDAAGAQSRELLRDDRLIDAERPLQILHAGLAAGDEHFEQPDADRVRERPEELGLEGLQLSVTECPSRLTRLCRRVNWARRAGS